MTIIHPHSTLHIVKAASLNRLFIRFRNSLYEAAGIVKMYTSRLVRCMWNDAQLYIMRRSLPSPQSSALERADSNYPEDGGNKLGLNVANYR
jgi:hypothetical protein